MRLLPQHQLVLYFRDPYLFWVVKMNLSTRISEYCLTLLVSEIRPELISLSATNPMEILKFALLLEVLSGHDIHFPLVTCILTHSIPIHPFSTP